MRPTTAPATFLKTYEGDGFYHSYTDEMLLNSAHDCSDGGLAVAIAECCFSSNGRKAIGAEIELTTTGLSPESLLFGESPSRIVISFDSDHLERVRELAADCPLEVIGRLAGSGLQVSVNGDPAIKVAVAELESIWSGSLSAMLENPSK